MSVKFPSQLPISGCECFVNCAQSGSLPSLPCHLMLGETKPCNLLFIMADQHRHDYVGAPFAGSSTVTPVLDHFRDLGAHFQQERSYMHANHAHRS